MRTPRPTTFVLSAMVLLLPLTAAAESRLALVVGNTDYRALPPLRTAAVDARQLGAALEQLGFETRLGIDLDAAAFRQAVQDAAQDASGAEALVIAYFGHGQQVDQLSYLLPTDFGTATTPDVQLDSIALHTVLQAASQAAVGIVLVDAGRATGLEMVGAELGLAIPRSLPPGVIVGFSAEPGTVIEDDFLFQSAYGSALAASVGEPDLALGDLLLRVRQVVLNDTGGAQRPAVYGPVETVAFSFNPAPTQPMAEVDPAPYAEAPDEAAEAPESIAETMAPPAEASEAILESAVRPAMEPVPDDPAAPALADEPTVLDPVHASPATEPSEPVVGNAPAEPETQVSPRADDVADAATEEPVVSADPAIAALPADAGDPTPVEEDALRQSPAEDSTLTAEERRAVQRSLRTLGLYDYPIDAIFGPVTRAGIRAFQDEIGAEVTGHLSPAQIDRLHALAAERAG